MKLTIVSAPESSFPFPKPWHTYNTNMLLFFNLQNVNVGCDGELNVFHERVYWKFFFEKDGHMYDSFIIILICFWSYMLF